MGEAAARRWQQRARSPRIRRQVVDAVHVGLVTGSGQKMELQRFAIHCLLFKSVLSI
jgi:hypothetical protein